MAQIRMWIFSSKNVKKKKINKSSRLLATQKNVDASGTLQEMIQTTFISGQVQ